MHGNSRQIISNQNGVHPDLKTLLRKHQQTEYLQPLRPFSKLIFEQIKPIAKQVKLPLIIDAGCGTGTSTQLLAERNPNHLVIGVDKSLHRLHSKLNQKPFYHEDNLVLVRFDLIDFWRLAVKESWVLEKHYFLYPNPWPKKKHLIRRWYAHPVFPYILKLGGRLECRSNWSCYIDEFSECLHYLGYKHIENKRIEPIKYVSPFEKKYHHSDHRLYQLICELDSKIE